MEVSPAGRALFGVNALVIVNVVLVALVFVALGVGADGYDRWLTRRRTPAMHR